MKVMGAPADMVPEYGPERKVNAVSRRLSSTEKAERLLGFKAEVSLEEGVRRFVTWWEANKDRFN
jgi:UDP-glucose 4-epimerase